MSPLRSRRVSPLGRLWQAWRVGLLATRFRLPLLLVTLAVVYGVVGYRVLEGYDLIEALYQTMITLSTVGTTEVEPLSPAGRLFTVTLIVLGLVALFDLLGAFTSLLASGELALTMQRRAMRRRIAALSDHYVICAYGRVGRAAARELESQDAAVVVLEPRPELEPLLQEAGLPYLIGDPTQEPVLEAAGITRAKALLCAVDSDADNVFITLTARFLSPGLFIVARASSPESVAKLERAGANRVVSPYVVSGTRMASLALRPAMVEFVDMVSVAPDLRVEMVMVGPRSGLASQTVKEACAPYPGVWVLALKKAGGQLFVPPRADTTIDHGDLLIAAGPVAALSEIAEMETPTVRRRQGDLGRSDVG